mgnify:CR=1 FL=1|jgi:hypothetical protein
MQIWLEIVGSFPERAGKYLICPINSMTKKDLPLYKILEEPKRDDLVFHYVLSKASKQSSRIISYSKVSDNCYITKIQDPLCQSPPPYRKIDLNGNKRLIRPITIDMLSVYRIDLENIVKESGSSRTPFNKNFKIKQLYLARIPEGFLDIFSMLSKTKFRQSLYVVNP